METKITVRYCETDQMGVVHHTNYLVWFEVGRTDYIKKLGITNTYIESRGILLPVIHIACNYLKPAKYEDELLIKTKIQKLTLTRLEFAYEVINMHTEQLLVTGYTSHVWTNKALKPVNIKKVLPELWSTLNNLNI